MSKKKSIFAKISTMPSIDAMKWAGKERSILSTILLWGIWVCRVFSLLQISKLVLRTILKWTRKGTTDKNATRINVPPLFCEIYFLIWFLVFVAGHLLHWSHPIYTAAICYYLFESVIWVLYYTIFRRFYEENYSIYHELEYFSVLFFLIPTQALGFATLYDQSFRNMIAGLLGTGTDADPFPVRILGALFSAIVVSMIISTFPVEKVKKKEKKSQTFIIGCGDVVEKRLYSALLNGGNLAEDIHVYDLEAAETRQNYCEYLPSQEAITQKIASKIGPDDAVWIETPSYAHISYLKQLTGTPAGLIVLEKPICINPEELNYVAELVEDEEARRKLFFLSYYVLEKALPLCYLSQQNERHKKYLQIEDESLINNWRLLMGPLQSIEVNIHEGADDRKWVYDKANGGQCMETFIHNILISTMFIGDPQGWDKAELTVSEDGNEVQLTGSCGQALIRLSMRKNVKTGNEESRARLVFANGTVIADMGEKRAELFFSQLDHKCTVAVKKKYRGKYVIQADMVKSVLAGTYCPADVDGLCHQTEAIRWLLENYPN